MIGARFQAAGQAPWYDMDFERSLGTACDAVLAVSRTLADVVGERCRRKAHLAPNAWSPDLLHVAGPVPIDRGTITLGYFGHLTEAWFDWDLLIECARRRPDWRIELIGYGGGWRTTHLPPNVSYIGKLPRAALAAYAAAWDAAIIPFRAGEVSAAADPIKTYEYLALDLPVVGAGIVPLRCGGPGARCRRCGRFLARRRVGGGSARGVCLRPACLCGRKHVGAPRRCDHALAGVRMSRAPPSNAACSRRRRERHLRLPLSDPRRSRSRPALETACVAGPRHPADAVVPIGWARPLACSLRPGTAYARLVGPRRTLALRSCRRPLRDRHPRGHRARRRPTSSTEGCP